MAEGGGGVERWKRPAHQGFDPSVIAAPENSLTHTHTHTQVPLTADGMDTHSGT